jgi:GT2 family glycosyltransferase
LALSHVESEWVFFNDDDNKFSCDLIENVFERAEQYGASIITTAYLQEHESQDYILVHQSGILVQEIVLLKLVAWLLSL